MIGQLIAPFRLPDSTVWQTSNSSERFGSHKTGLKTTNYPTERLLPRAFQSNTTVFWSFCSHFFSRLFSRIDFSIQNHWIKPKAVRRQLRNSFHRVTMRNHWNHFVALRLKTIDMRMRFLLLFYQFWLSPNNFTLLNQHVITTDLQIEIFLERKLK